MKPSFLGANLLLFFALSATGAGFRDGPALTAELSQPWGIAIAADGTMFVADKGNHTIRQIRNGVVTTLAGLAGQSGLRDGRGGAARFSRPEGLAVDSRGAIWVADSGNNAIRRVSRDGVVETIAGRREGHPRFIIDLESPAGVAVAADGTIYIADQDNGTIRRIAPNGSIENDPTPRSGWTSSKGFRPGALAIDRRGKLYVADVNEGGLYQVVSGKTMILIAGGADGAIKLERPHGIAFRSDGAILVATESGYMERSDGGGAYGGWGDSITIIGAAGKPARFGKTCAEGVATDATGRVFITTYDDDRIVEITAAGDVTVAGIHAEPHARYEYSRQQPTLPTHHRALVGQTISLPPRRNGNWEMLRRPSASATAAHWTGGAAFVADVADLFDFQFVPRSGPPADPTRYEVIEPKRDARKVTAALWEMSPLPLSDAEVEALIGRGKPPDPRGDPIKLAHYWSGVFDVPQDVHARLTAAAGQLSDDDLIAVLKLIDPTTLVLERMRRYAAKHPGDERTGVSAWLEENDPERQPDRIAKLSALPEQFVLREDWRLERAAKNDWIALEPMLEQWSARPSVRFRAAAFATRYRHAIDHGDEVRAIPLRGSLKTIVEDRSAPGMARWTALGALTMQTGAGYYFLDTREWPGRDDWLLSLFSDPTFHLLRDDSNMIAPLEIVAGGAPGRFVPLLLPILSGDNEARRQNAASALASMLEIRDVIPGASRRPEIGEPMQRRITTALLPWITEHPLSDEDARRKNYVIDSATRLSIKEAAPQIEEARKEPALRDAADGALARFNGISLSELCRELAQRATENERLWLFGRLWSSAHLPAGEIAAAVEAWARHQSEPGVRTFLWGENLPLDASIGRYASEHLDERPDVVRAMVLRLEALPTSDRVVADAMVALLDDSGVVEAMDFIVRRIEQGEADASLIAAALRRREAFYRSAETAVGQRSSGSSRAIVAAMLRDSDAAARILQTGDATRPPFFWPPPGSVAGNFRCSRSPHERTPTFRSARWQTSIWQQWTLPRRARCTSRATAAQFRSLASSLPGPTRPQHAG